MNAKVDVLAVLSDAASDMPSHEAEQQLMEARAAVAEMIDGPYSQRARLGHLLDALRFDEQLNGSNPRRSTLDFPHAIQIVEAAIAALSNIGPQS